MSYALMAPKQYQPMFDALSSAGDLKVKEKASMAEALTAMIGQEVEMPNRYRITDEDDNELFFATEQTDCCTRQAKQACPDCVGWTLDFKYTQNDASEDFLELKREWTFTCCCFNRPKATLMYADTQEEIATIHDPWACCDLDFTVDDPEGHRIMSVEGGGCQPGILCPCPFGPCAVVHFDIKDADGHDIGEIEKTLSCCNRCFAPDVDNYKVEFDHVDDPTLKMLAMATAVFIDFRLFSDNSNDERS